MPQTITPELIHRSLDPIVTMLRFGASFTATQADDKLVAVLQSFVNDPQAVAMLAAVADYAVSKLGTGLTPGELLAAALGHGSAAFAATGSCEGFSAAHAASDHGERNPGG